MEPAEMTDEQLNRHIADRKAKAQLAKDEMEQALDEWRSRHGQIPGTEYASGGVIVRLETSSRWDDKRAWGVLESRPEMVERISKLVLDRAEAKKVLDAETYAQCQKVSEKPRVRVIIEQDSLI